MVDVSAELVTAATAVASVAVGYGGKMLQDWAASRRQDRRREREVRARQARDWLLPLLAAAADLRIRLGELAEVYGGGRVGPFSPASLSGDFRELYLLDPGEIADLLASDPNQPRRDERAVQRLRQRMSYELNFATSSLYRTARYLAVAGRVRDAAREGRIHLPREPLAELVTRLEEVAAAFQGPTGAGLFVEQQESIAELMRDPDGKVISNLRFRHQLLALPGWEQFAALLIFFISEDDRADATDARARFCAKVPYEVTATIQALTRLEAALTPLAARAEASAIPASP